MTYQVVVPSYARSGLIEDKTLRVLAEGGVPPSNVTVLLHEHEPDKRAYESVARRCGVNVAVTPARGLVEQRNLAGQLFPWGERVVTVDDDLRAIDKLDPQAAKFRPVRDVHAQFTDMFEITESEGLKAWGFSPTNRAQWAKDSYATHLKFCIFNCVGFVNEPGHPAQNLDLTIKDDYQHTLLRWWHDGGIVRHDGVYARASVYTTPGGLQATRDRRAAVAESAVQQLEQEWPGIVRRNNRRNTGFAEITLTPRPRHTGREWGCPPPGRGA